MFKVKSGQSYDRSKRGDVDDDGDGRMAVVTELPCKFVGNYWVWLINVFLSRVIFVILVILCGALVTIIANQ